MDSLGEGRSKNSSASNDVLDMFNPSVHHQTMPDRERKKTKSCIIRQAEILAYLIVTKTSTIYKRWGLLMIPLYLEINH